MIRNLELNMVGTSSTPFRENLTTTIIDTAYSTKFIRHPSSERFAQILEELLTLHDRKQKDYGTDKDPFNNVRGAEEWGVKSWVAALVRASDKMRRLQKAAKGGSLEFESVNDSLRDLANYAVIALVLYEQDQGQGKVSGNS